MSTPPEPDGLPAGGPPGPRLPMVRAGLVLAAFVVVTVLLLGVIHPTSATSASGPTTTGPPVGSTTTTTTAANTTSTSAARNSATSSSVPPSHVSVLVANASGVSGAAAAVTALLQPSGWNMEAPVNASAHVASSSVYYLAGQHQSALAIASTLHLASSAVVPYTTAAPISSIGTAGVVVVVGPDLASRSAGSPTTTAAAAPRSSTTTTTHH